MLLTPVPFTLDNPLPARTGIEQPSALLDASFFKRLLGDGSPLHTDLSS
jgi:hypothetical protein